MAISRTLAKHRERHLVEGSLPSSLAKGTSIIKKLKERALSLPGKLPAPSILLIFALRLERESAPADYCLELRIFIDRSCPSLPSKVFITDEVRPNEQTTGSMAAHGCHFVGCCLYVLVVNIEVFSFTLRFVGASCFV